MDISGLDKAEVLIVLYNHARTQGIGILRYDSNPMTNEEAKVLLEKQTYFDTWDDLSEQKKEKYRKELWDRIECDGVWSLVGEYWDGSEWVHADSCGGFIGDDWKDSGHDTDIMSMTISAYSDHLEAEARKLESKRPDMYEFGSVKTHEPHGLKEGDMGSVSVDPEHPDCVIFHKI